MSRTRLAVALAASLATAALSSPAVAKAKHDSPYTYEQTFGSTLRQTSTSRSKRSTPTGAF